MLGVARGDRRWHRLASRVTETRGASSLKFGCVGGTSGDEAVLEIECLMMNQTD